MVIRENGYFVGFFVSEMPGKLIKRHKSMPLKQAMRSKPFYSGL